MRILFLDDNQERHSVFRRVSAGHRVVHVDTASAAMLALKREEFDLVYLDHDLGGPESEGKMLEGVEDGRWLAGKIAENAEFFGGTIFIIHSLNFAAAARMSAVLADARLAAVVVPFAWNRVPVDPDAGDGQTQVVA